jgi:hypothetical protein
LTFGTKTPDGSVLVRVSLEDLTAMRVAGIRASAPIPQSEREAQLCDAIAQMTDLLETLQARGLGGRARQLAVQAIRIGVDAAMDDTFIKTQGGTQW